MPLKISGTIIVVTRDTTTIAIKSSFPSAKSSAERAGSAVAAASSLKWFKAIRPTIIATSPRGVIPTPIIIDSFQVIPIHFAGRPQPRIFVASATTHSTTIKSIISGCRYRRSAIIPRDTKKMDANII